MSLTEIIQRGRTTKPPRILIYGTEGIGKSTFASQAPSPIFLQTEDGLDALEADRFPLATSFGEVTSALSDLQSEAHDYGTIVIDSLSALERLIHDEVCRESGVSTIEKADGGFAKGYVHALTFWREILGSLNTLRNERGMAVVLISHAKVERYEDPESTSYDRYAPRLHKHASGLVCEWSDAVLFATRKMRTQSEDVGFGRSRSIAHPIGKEGGERILRTVGSPSCIAKNRFGATDELPLSWAAFVASLSHSSEKE